MFGQGYQLPPKLSALPRSRDAVGLVAAFSTMNNSCLTDPSLLCRPSGEHEMGI